MGLLLFQWQHEPDLLATVSLLLMLAILVNTPLALSLVQGKGSSFLAFRWASWLQPVAALGVAWSLMNYTGGVDASGFDGLRFDWSAWLTVPWLIVALLLAVSALWRLRHIVRMTASERMRLAALFYLAIGAAWLVAFQLGLQPMGFSGIIVLLTAVHFHFTGFAATIWASRIGEMVPRSKRAYAWFASGFVIATPLIAAGITLSPLLEIGGVLLLATSLIGLTVLLYRHLLPSLAGRSRRPSKPALFASIYPSRLTLSKLLLAISPLAMCVAILLAVIYGMGEYLQRSWLTIPQMVQWHGWLNAVGFTFLGLLGWRLAEEDQAAR